MEFLNAIIIGLPVWAIGLLVVLVATFALSIVMLNKKKREFLGAMVFIYALYAIFLTLIVGRAFAGQSKYELVIISEEHSLDDMYEEYRIIEKRGRVCVIEDLSE